MSERWLDRALRLLAEHGHRTGDARSTIVELLAREGGCLTAEEVVDRLRRDGSRVGTASVYRALGLLTELGLLQRAALGDGPVRYDLVDAEAGHHHHLVCGRCGRTATFEDPRLEAAIQGVARDVDYAVDAHDVTLRGTCPECARRKQPAA